MTSTIFTDLKVNNAEQFVESISEPANTKVYLCYGKTDAWANEASPAMANSSIGTVYEVWSNMIGGKRILGGDLRHVIPRKNWTTGTVYNAYDHTTPNLFDANNNFYVMTSNYDVYKCIANNYGATSISEPSAINPASTTVTADSYVWKYMYTISDAEKLRFLTETYMPVKTLVTDDGSLQFQVQDQATPGSIDSIVVTSGGINYTNASVLTVTVTGDGAACIGTATVNTATNTVSSIVVTEPGQGYTYADVTITGGAGSGAQARAVIGPPGGHGSDPLYELGGKNVMINGRIKYDESGVLPVTNDYRQISLVKDPDNYGSTGNVSSALAILQATTVTCDGTGDFIADEFVYQGTNLATATFSGRVLSWNSTTSQLLLINIKGSPTSSQSIIGSSSFTSRVVTAVSPGDLRSQSGRLLYVDNIVPVTRSSDQIESYQILVKF